MNRRKVRGGSLWHAMRSTVMTVNIDQIDEGTIVLPSDSSVLVLRHSWETRFVLVLCGGTVGWIGEGVFFNRNQMMPMTGA